MDAQMEKEMVKHFIVKNRQMRTQWELETARRRGNGISRFTNGFYLNTGLFIALHNQDDESVLRMIKKMGGADKAYVMSSSYCDFFSARKGLKLARYNECMFAYFGNGVGYYHEEWEGGKTGEYLLQANKQ